MSFDGTILALDPASTTGVCEGRPGCAPTLSAWHLKQDETDGPEDICGRAIHRFADRLRSDLPALIVIEQPFPPRSFDAGAITLGLFGVFSGIARCKGIRVIKAPIQSWRLYFLGRGNLNGPEAKRQSMKLCKQLGWHAPTHDAAEAAGIWSWGCSQVDPRRAPRVEPLFLRGAA